jgi:hypothetical protein
MKEVYEWLETTHKKYPDFDLSKWIPHSVRTSNNIEDKFKYLSNNFPEYREQMNYLFWRDYTKYISFIEETITKLGLP